MSGSQSASVTYGGRLLSAVRARDDAISCPLCPVIWSACAADLYSSKNSPEFYSFLVISSWWVFLRERFFPIFIFSPGFEPSLDFFSPPFFNVFPPLLVFLLALVAYILWWLRSNLFELAFATRFFFVPFLRDTFEKLLGYHVYLILWSCFGGKKWRLCRSFMDNVQKGSPFSPRLAFWRFYFIFSIFLCVRSWFWPTCNLICWCWHWQTENELAAPLSLSFLLSLNSISQEWCSLLFQARFFHPPCIVCFKLRLSLF